MTLRNNNKKGYTVMIILTIVVMAVFCHMILVSWETASLFNLQKKAFTKTGIVVTKDFANLELR